MKKTKKQLDAVLTMREIRDRLSAQIEGMSFEQEKRFVQQQVRQSKGRRSVQPRSKSPPRTNRA